MNPSITPLEDGPFEAKDIPQIKDGAGNPVAAENPAYLCRCGASKNKPFCDGSHSAAGFTSKRVRKRDKPAAEFAGRDLTIVDDAGLCAHAGHCVAGAPDTFFTKGEDGRVSHPDASPTDQVIATIRKCPSGSLLYRRDGRIVDDYAESSEIEIEKDGPLLVRKVELKEADPATQNHYTLCRCGASLNKPFCDGMHAKIKFSDES